MSKHWKEKTKEGVHIDFMHTYHIQGLPVENSPEKGEWVYFVNVCSFTFQFVSTDQIKRAIEYFSLKIHPSGREFNNGLEHYWQKWTERLPAGLNGGSKRKRVLNALQRAVQEFEK